MQALTFFLLPRDVAKTTCPTDIIIGLYNHFRMINSPVDATFATTLT
jgi:hypothetical protein